MQIQEPEFCQYCRGRCDQDMSDLEAMNAFFIYPSEPANLSLTVSQAVCELQKYSSHSRWESWETLKTGGRIIFCRICQAIRSADGVIANITTLNFNVLFELGHLLGLRKPVLPIRDTTYERDRALFDELGIFDTLGYEDFRNSQELSSLVQKWSKKLPAVSAAPGINSQQPIFCVKSPVETDGSLRLMSSLRKSWFRFRTFDCSETPRLSMHEAYRQVLSSTAVVAHMIDPERTGAKVHNARVAIVAGMAMAAEKRVLVFQEGAFVQPIDYRDVVIPYTDHETIAYFVEDLVSD